jgi:hypothetical protein
MATQAGFLFYILGVFPVLKDCLLSLLLGPPPPLPPHLRPVKGVPWNPDARGYVKYLQKLGHFYVFCSYFNCLLSIIIIIKNYE